MISNTNPPVTSTKTTYNTILDYFKASDPGERAVDIWWFVLPWEMAETQFPFLVLRISQKLLSKWSHNHPFWSAEYVCVLISRKQFLLCHCLYLMWSRKWKRWKNGNGGITTTIRTHLTNKHGLAYQKALEQNELWSLWASNQFIDDNDEEFDLETWFDLLADYVVVNDEVRLLPAFINHVLILSYSQLM